MNPDWFDPLSTATDASGMHPSLAAHLPHLLSELELDQAELEARVALNQLQADTGEQIHLWAQHCRDTGQGCGRYRFAQTGARLPAVPTPPRSGVAS